MSRLVQKPFQVPHTLIEQFTLDNGLRVVFNEDHSVPVVSVAVGDTELFGEVPDGIRVAADNPAALAAALHDALKMPREPRRSLLPPGLGLREAAQAVVAVYRQAMAS